MVEPSGGRLISDARGGRPLERRAIRPDEGDIREGARRRSASAGPSTPCSRQDMEVQPRSIAGSHDDAGQQDSRRWATDASLRMYEAGARVQQEVNKESPELHKAAMQACTNIHMALCRGLLHNPSVFGKVSEAPPCRHIPAVLSKARCGDRTTHDTCLARASFDSNLFL